DNKLVAFGGAAIEVRDAATGALRVSVPTHGGPEAIRFSNDGARVLVSTWDGYVDVLDVASGRVMWSTSNGSPEDALAPSPDGSTMAHGDWDGGLWVRDLATGVERKRLDGDGHVTALAFSKDGAHLWVASSSVRELDVATGASLATYHGGTFALAPDNSRL